VQVAAGNAPDGVKGEQADGLCSDVVGLGLSVHTADCVPVLFADPRTGACAALHAGWRGTVAGMGPAGVRALVDNFGCQPGDLRVALGPCIAPCCFEVGPRWWRPPKPRGLERVMQGSFSRKGGGGRMWICAASCACSCRPQVFYPSISMPARRVPTAIQQGVSILSTFWTAHWAAGRLYCPLTVRESNSQTEASLSSGKGIALAWWKLLGMGMLVIERMEDDLAKDSRLRNWIGPR